jgi:pimeloyl-ACP methyl ester carboxylesterase
MKQFSESQTATHTTAISGVNIFYREAGDASKPTIVLLHGFPSSSHEFRELIPLLADRFHVIAPDYPGMGYSEAPDPAVLRPTFDDVAKVFDVFIAQHASGPVILYLYDIGGSIGLRIAMAQPERIAGLIFQNVTITQDGWNPERLKFYEWVGGPETPEKLAATEKLASEARDKYLHQTGAHRPDALNPDNWAIDTHAFSIPESRAFMSRLLMNMSANFPQYPKWAAYLKEWQPKTLVLWGETTLSSRRRLRKP